MRAVIVAGGMGTRLLPQTEKKPKCLVEVNNKPIINYQLDVLIELNITEVAIVIGHFGEQIVDHTQKYYSDKIDFTYFENTKYRETQNAYSLWLAKDFLLSQNDGFIILNSDLIFQKEMLSLLINQDKADGMIVDTCEDMSSDMVKVRLDHSRIIEMSKSLPAGTTKTEGVGPVKFSTEGGKKFMSFLEQYFVEKDKKNWLFYMLGDYGKNNDFYAIQNPGYTWAEIDNTNDLLEAERKCGDTQ